MSRYKKASLNEKELAEVGGSKPILRPTRDEKMSVIELFMEQQKNKGLDIKKATKVLTDLLYNSLFLWENKKRTDKKEVGSEDIERDDIEDYVVSNVFELWLEVLNALDIIDKKKLEQLQKEQEAKVKAEQEKEDPN
jgi:hypothetical protein